MFQSTYFHALEGCHVPWQPARWPNASELWFNRPLADELGLDWAQADGPTRASWLGGQALLPGMMPLAQAYAGHQFGGFSPQLGDGRALLLGEWVDRRGQRHDLALKGSGRTPFSRGGDGKAAVGPMLREVIMGEAMHALGVPTTRALGVVATGEPVMRERPLPGAVLMRVASSHLRVGTFEYFAARQETDKLRRVVDYAMARHDPELSHAPEPVLAFLMAVIQRQAQLVAQWMNLGFIHGVMNTDNMTISGQTIDYGPCAFMEAFDPAAVFSSIDRQGRYAWGQQPPIAQWNLARLAEALLPLIDAEEDRALEKATAALGGFASAYSAAVAQGQRRKLGLIVEPDPHTQGRRVEDATVRPLDSHDNSQDDERDRALTSDWLALLHRSSSDYTRSWRALASAIEGREGDLRAEVSDGEGLNAWLARWRARLDSRPANTGVGGQRVSLQAVAHSMRRCNPAVIPRNHMVEEALSAASEGQDLEPMLKLLAAVTQPYDEAVWHTPFAQAAPPEVAARHRTFCGT